MVKTVADQFAETLATAGEKRIYGIASNGLNGLPIRCGAKPRSSGSMSATTRCSDLADNEFSAFGVEGSPMDVTALLLSRIQFAFTVSFHIIYPSFTIGLAAWLTVLEALYQSTGRAAYRVVFEFWLKIFGLAFGLGRRLRHRDGFSVRHELERAVQDVRTDTGAVAVV